MADENNQNLIESSKVDGTRVFSANGEEAGHIDHLLIDKPSGKIAYAVMTFGGLWGLGSDTHPIPWSALDYDTELGGYRTGITKDQLQNAPERERDWVGDRRREEVMYTHYGYPGYRMKSAQWEPGQPIRPLTPPV